MNVIAQFLTFAGVLAFALVAAGLRPAFLIPAYGVLALAAVVSWSPKRHESLSSRTIPCLLAAAGFFGYILLRTVLSPVDYVARPDLFMVLGALIVYLITALCATSPTSRVVFASGFLLLACAQVLLGAIQFSKGDNFMPFDFLPRGDYGKRASGCYGCPNHLAGFLEITMLMALSLTFWSRWKMLGKIAAGYTALVCGVGLVLTGSRGGQASAVAGLFVFAMISLALARNWMWREIWLFLVTVLVFAAIGAGYLAYAGIHHTDFLSHRISYAGSDASIRFNFWRAAFEQFKSSPIFGTGSGTYLYYGRLFRPLGVEQDPIYTHNDYLQLLAEFGLVAFAGLGAFLFYHLRSGWTFIADIIARRTVDGERDAPGFHGDNSLAITTGSVCGIAALLVHSVVDFNLHIPPNTFVMAFLFGTLANPFSVLIPEAKQAGGNAQAFLRRIPLALPLLGIWLALAALPKWSAERFADKAKSLLANGSLILQADTARAAADFAQQALARDPKNPEMYLALGDSFTALAEIEDDPARQDESYRQAIDAYLRGEQVAPMDVHFPSALAAIYDDLKRFDKAAPFHQQALALDKNSYDVRWAYANHLYLQGKLNEAEAIFTVLNNHLGAYHSLDLIRKDREKLKQPTAP